MLFLYKITFLLSHIILFYKFQTNINFSKKVVFPKSLKTTLPLKDSSLNLLVGYSQKQPVFISEKGLYQNILITGTIGTGKTSSAMYPFTKQLLQYECNNPKEKLAMLILDVKGNYYKEVLK